jgi:translation initiation factor 3 subunit A
LIDISEKRTNEARNKADKVALAAAAKVADLDQEESPESILLSSMTEEASKHRTDREVVVPWLKFLWETYRTILELLHKNSKYDRLYHKTCEKAFKFCEDYKRNMEFRRLCEILRGHLSTLQKLTVTTNRTNKVVFEWTPEIIDAHLKTRLEQLEVATSLEQWNEGFRIVEDIYSIMTAVKKTPKARVMAAYYEKLTRIFWVSENYLFHAYAWFKFYCLVTESKREVKAEDRALFASNVLIAALIIPSFYETDATTMAASNMSAEVDDLVVEKNQQMAMLLDFQSNPTRQNLLADIVAKGIHREVLPELSKLYDAFEVDFKPLTLPTTVSSIVAAISSHPTLHIYSMPLQQVSVLRVVQQLSKVYGTMKIQKIQSILKPFPSLTYTQIEKLMIDGVVKKQLSVRIDHVNQCLRFGSIDAVGQAAETQIMQFGNQLNKSVFKLTEQRKSAADVEAEVKSRREYMSACASSAHEIYLKSAERKGLIDNLKNELELAQQRKEETDRLRREEIERQRLDEMKKQLDTERDAREKQRQILEDLRKECERLAAEIERYNSSADVDDLMKMDANARQAVLTKAKSDYLKFKEEQQRKLVEQAKKLDFITRAQRMEASKIVKENYSKQLAADRMAYDQRNAVLIEEEKKVHAQNLVEKQRYQRMQAHRGVFESKFIDAQRRGFEDYFQDCKERAVQAYHEDKLNHARSLYHRELERQRLAEEVERQRLAKEENDRIAKENDEKLRKKRAEEEALQREREAEEEKRRGDKRFTPSTTFRPNMSKEPSVGESTSWRGGSSAAPPMIAASIPISGADNENSWRTAGPTGKAVRPGFERQDPPPAPTTPSAADTTDKWRRGPVEAAPASEEKPGLYRPGSFGGGKIGAAAPPIDRGFGGERRGFGGEQSGGDRGGERRGFGGDQQPSDRSFGGERRGFGGEQQPSDRSFGGERRGFGGEQSGGDRGGERRGDQQPSDRGFGGERGGFGGGQQPSGRW